MSYFPEDDSSSTSPGGSASEAVSDAAERALSRGDRASYAPARTHGVPSWFEVVTFARMLRPVIACGMVNFRTPRQAAALLSGTVRFGFSTAAQLERAVARDPQRTALIDDDGPLTYRELTDAVRSFAAWLISQGVTTDSRVAVMARNGRGIIIPLGAKGYLGHDIVLLNPASSGAQLGRVIADHGIDVLIIDEEFVPRIPAVVADSGLAIVVAHRESDGPATVPGATNVPVPAMTLADAVEAGAPLASSGQWKPRPFVRSGRIVIMSSGTTGTPKGVIYAEPQTPKAVGGILDRIPWKQHLTIHQTASIFHAWGWANINLAFGARATVITRRIFDPLTALNDAEQHQCNAFISSPVFLKKMMETEAAEVAEGRQPRALPPTRFIVTSGNALPPYLAKQLIERFGPVVCNFYGSTEIGQVTAATPQELMDNPASTGRALLGVRMSIRDDEGREVPPGTVGHIYAANGMMFRGYSDPTIPIVEADRQVDLGDLGYMDEDGYLYVCGRSDDMIINGGENVHPAEVEASLSTMPGVIDCYIAADRTDPVETRTEAFVVRGTTRAGSTGSGGHGDDAEEVTADAVRDWIRNDLMEAAVPRHVHFVDSLPRNANGKVVKRELVRPGFSGRS